MKLKSNNPLHGGGAFGHRRPCAKQRGIQRNEKKLVAYFLATGTTRAAAQRLA